MRRTNCPASRSLDVRQWIRSFPIAIRSSVAGPNESQSQKPCALEICVSCNVGASGRLGGLPCFLWSIAASVAGGCARNNRRADSSGDRTVVAADLAGNGAGGRSIDTGSRRSVSRPVSGHFGSLALDGIRACSTTNTPSTKRPTCRPGRASLASLGLSPIVRSYLKYHV